MTRAYINDVSKHQVAFDPNHAVKPIDGAIQRMSWGMNTDERITEIFRGVSQLNRRMAYHYYSSNAPWKDQANKFLDLQSGKKFLGMAVDYEHGYNNLTKRTALELEKFLHYLAGQRPGKKVVGYSGTYVYRDFIEYYVDLSMFDWWFARYPFFPRPETGAPRFPLNMKRKDWSLWQYSKTGKGSLYGAASQYIDLNVFNGTVAEFETWLGMDEDVPTPEPDPPIIPLSCEERVTNLEGWAEMLGFEK